MAGMTVSRPAVPTSPEHALAPPTLGQVLEVVQGLWPRELAEPWDAVGPVAGRPEAPVRTVLWALDPVQAVADEAVARGADLVVTHHPLLLRGTSSVAAVGHAAAKGRLLHTLIEHRIALLAAHTNADAVVGGVSDVLARAVGVTGALSPLTTSAAGTGAEGIGRVGDLPEETDLAAFARADGAHAQAIRAVREGRWFAEELYARFRIDGTEGSWGGRDPLAAQEIAA